MEESNCQLAIEFQISFLLDKVPGVLSPSHDYILIPWLEHGLTVPGLEIRDICFVFLNQERNGSGSRQKMVYVAPKSLWVKVAGSAIGQSLR